MTLAHARGAQPNAWQRARPEQVRLPATLSGRPEPGVRPEAARLDSPPAAPLRGVTEQRQRRTSGSRIPV
jgi:hypothetical protein